MTTKSKAMIKRVPARARGNIMNVNPRLAGFKEGAASVNAKEGPRRWLRRYTAGKIRATQQEHNMSGAPAAAAASCGLISPCPKRVAKRPGEIVAWTAALMSTPKTRAGQTIFRYARVCAPVATSSGPGGRRRASGCNPSEPVACNCLIRLSPPAVLSPINPAISTVSKRIETTVRGLKRLESAMEATGRLSAMKDLEAAWNGKDTILRAEEKRDLGLVGAVVWAAGVPRLLAATRQRWCLIWLHSRRSESCQRNSGAILLLVRQRCASPLSRRSRLASD